MIVKGKAANEYSCTRKFFYRNLYMTQQSSCLKHGIVIKVGIVDIKLEKGSGARNYVQVCEIVPYWIVCIYPNRSHKCIRHPKNLVDSFHVLNTEIYFNKWITR